MELKFILLLFYISLINKALSSSDYDLEKYGKLEKISDAMILLDSHDFKLDEEIYIILTGYFFETYIQYIFIDSIPDFLNNNFASYDSKLIKEYSNKVDKLNEVGLEKRYYTIEKTQSHLNGKEGKYLALYLYA